MYDKTHPFPASIKERHLLSKSGSMRHTYHIVLDLKGSDLKYRVGDSIGVFAPNDPTIVEKTLKAMRAKSDEPIKDRSGEKTFPLADFLSHKANLGQFSRRLVAEVAARQHHIEKKERLEALLNTPHHDALKAFQEQRHVWDFLEENEEACFAPQEICSLLMPLLPRLYSIASAQESVGDEVHLTVSHLMYHSNGHEREGVATSFLCRRAETGVPNTPLYIQPHHGFTLPEDHSARIIMVGPGTGVAPFRAFMQRRALQTDAGNSWLFFGEWQRAYDFFYEDFWASIPSLRTTTAFSRDQEHKIYVQHRMQEHSQEIYEWLEGGAFLYVCGDAHRMAKDVDATLHQIFEAEGKMDAESARKAVKQLRASKRYLRDIY